MRRFVLGVALVAALALATAAAASADATAARRAPGALVLVIDRSLTMAGPRLVADKLLVNDHDDRRPDSRGMAIAGDSRSGSRESTDLESVLRVSLWPRGPAG